MPLVLSSIYSEINLLKISIFMAELFPASWFLIFLLACGLYAMFLAVSFFNYVCYLLSQAVLFGLLLWTDTINKATLYKGQHLVGAGLQVQSLSPLSSWQEAQQCPGRCGTGGAESSTSSSKGSQEQTVLRQLGVGSQSLHLQGPPPTRPHLLIVSLPVPNIFKPPHRPNIFLPSSPVKWGNHHLSLCLPSREALLILMFFLLCRASASSSVQMAIAMNFPQLSTEI
jgi:hypothetical protein